MTRLKHFTPTAVLFSRSRTKAELKKHVSHIGAAPKIPVCLSASIYMLRRMRKKVKNSTHKKAGLQRQSSTRNETCKGTQQRAPELWVLWFTVSYCRDAAALPAAAATDGCWSATILQVCPLPVTADILARAATSSVFDSIIPHSSHDPHHFFSAPVIARGEDRRDG
jgi:hypothetical protein